MCQEKKSVSTHNGLVSDSFPEKKKMKKVVFDTNRDNNKNFKYYLWALT